MSTGKLMRRSARWCPGYAAVRALVGLTLFGIAGALQPAHAERIANGVAVFAALDKVTARISRLEVQLNKTAVFGSLKVTPRACFTRPPTEPPKTTAFVEVQDVKLDGTIEPNFSGWMFAQSPGLHAIEHPVFDVWLTDCGGAEPVAAATEAGTEAEAVDEEGQQPVRKRRPKRQ
jgi:hypothetical protein